MRDPAPKTVRPRTVALAGNPNSGKTTVFNALTGLRHKVGNYPGVTVERKEGNIRLEDGTQIQLIDLPGTYSLYSSSPDERVATDILLGLADHTERPDMVICVADAANLERSMYLVSQIIDNAIPVVLALNMVDLAERGGLRIDVPLLSSMLKVPVVPLVASKGEGVDDLRRLISTVPAHSPSRAWQMPEPVEREWAELSGLLQHHHAMTRAEATHNALALLTAAETSADDRRRYSPEVLDHLNRDWQKLEFLGYDRQTVAVDARYRWIHSITHETARPTGAAPVRMSDRIDRILTHRVWGILFFFGVMALMFQMIFSWAAIPMQWISDGFTWLSVQLRVILPAGDLRSLLLDGALAGIASVTMFLPQILLLFFFLGLLEESGYMARAALIMDRFMNRFGLHGKSFIPLLSSFACAIPGIMATRTIDDERDRLATMLVAPLISCSARLPVYSLLVAATVPATAVLGLVSAQALAIMSMYLIGLVAALSMATLLKKSLLKGTPPVFYLELPSYKVPGLKSIAIQMWERAVVFLKNAGTIILGASILIWFLATYPRLDQATASEQLQHSFAGRIGRTIEPAIAPLGFDWKIGIGLVSSLFQREMFVSTMGTIYNIQNDDASAGISLTDHMRNDVSAETGKRLFTPLTGISLMVFYALAMQCLSTVAIMRRETNGWKWPLFQIGYMTILAYAATYAVTRGGLALGMGG